MRTFKSCQHLAELMRKSGKKVEIKRNQHYTKWGYKYTYTLNNVEIKSCRELWDSLSKISKGERNDKIQLCCKIQNQWRI